jgi:hypothetical protein
MADRRREMQSRSSPPSVELHARSEPVEKRKSNAEREFHTIPGADGS